jgi:two-component system, OmpR family, phosphate regulon response regulator PhoB
MLKRLLIVDDEPAIRDMVAFALRKAEFEPVHAGDAREAQSSIADRVPDLILLDWMLPGTSGLELARRWRKDALTREVPIIMLTARGEETDRIVGLELGADDYIVKPFSAREVAARIRAVLRRTDSTQPAAAPTEKPGAIEVGPVKVDRDRREARVNNDEIDLTRKEFELLELLIREAGSVISRERLIDEVWDTNWFGSTKTLDVHVSSLRRKLGDDSQNPRFIHTVRGVGFRFAAADEL